MNKYGNRLRELREQRQYTQEALAKLLGTSRSRIAMYERGERQPDFEMQEAIADFFNVTIDYLFGRTDAETNTSNLDMAKVKEAMLMYNAYANATPEVRQAVEILLKATKPISDAAAHIEIPHLKAPQSSAELPHLKKDNKK